MELSVSRIRRIVRHLPHSCNSTGAHRASSGRDQQLEYDVAIVGAGVSGLVAAKELLELGVEPARIVVVEKRNRVGGRTYNKPLGKRFPGVFVESGGTWIGGTQLAAIELCEELGLELYSTYYKHEGDIPTSPATAAIYPLPEQAKRAFATIDKMAREVPLEDPWNAPNASHLDSISLQDWIDQQSYITDEDSRKRLANCTLLELGCYAKDVSFLFYLFWNRSVSGHHFEAGNRGGAQDFRLVEGSQAISERLTGILRTAGVKIEFNTCVDLVDIKRDSVALHTFQAESRESRRVFEAKHCVMAMSTGDASVLQYRGLPKERSELHEYWLTIDTTGVQIKSYTIYERAFWRERSDEVPVAGFWFDYSPPSGVPGVLMGFTNGPDTPQDQASRKNRQWTRLRKELGTDFEPIEYIEHRWGPEWKYDRGTVDCVQYFPPGGLTKFGVTWRKPRIGNLWWSGSDVAPVHMGYIDGAVRSGRRVATQVVQVLGSSVVPLNQVVEARGRESVRELADALNAFRVTKDVLDRAPRQKLDVKFNNHSLTPGQSLSSTSTLNPPTLRWKFDAGSKYTVLMVDLDIPSRDDRSLAEWLHWCVVNISPPNASSASSGEASNSSYAVLQEAIGRGDIIQEYSPPRSKSGTDAGCHRVVLLVYRQSGDSNIYPHPMPARSAFGWPQFSTRKFATTHRLGDCIAANFFLL